MRKDKPIDGKHEIYYTYKDYKNLYEECQLGKYNSDNNPLTKLLCAKAYFMQKDYPNTIKLLEKIDMNLTTKILYERQALLIKSLYLNNEHIQKIQMEYKHYEANKMKCPGRRLTNFHNASMKKLLEMAKIGKKQPLMDKEQIKKRCKQLGNKGKLEGLTCFILQKEWNKKWIKYIVDGEEHPGPITNFSLLNHIFQFEPQISTRHAYMDTLLFPVQQDIHYVVLRKQHWRLIAGLYGGLDIQRYTMLSDHGEDLYGADNLAKTLIQFEEERYVMQWQLGMYWENNVIPELASLFGPGQVKEQTNHPDEFIIVPYGLIGQPSTLLRYVSVNPEIIVARDSQEAVRRDKLINRFDMQRYSPSKSKLNGVVGLANLGNTCYMNAAIQCLSNIQQIKNYFVTNNFLSSLNISNQNKVGSFGAVPCALADLLKRLWFCSLSTKYIDPKTFKTTFETRFQQFRGFDQEDSSEFLVFLLNCLHDDLNQAEEGHLRRRDSVIERNFESARNHAISAYKQQNKSIISDLFSGHLFEEIHCRRCEKTRFRFEMFISLPIQIPLDCSNIKLFLVTAEKYDSPALSITVYLHEIQTVGKMLKSIKDSKNKQMNYHLFSVEKQDYTFRQQIEDNVSVKSLMQKQKMKSYHLFVYELPPKKDDQLYCAIFYTYNQDKPDGFPRILPIKKGAINENSKNQEEEKKRQKTIKQKVLETISLQRREIEDIERVEYRDSKDTLYGKIIQVEMKKPLKMFSHNPYNKKIGNDGKNGNDRKLESCLKKLQEKEEISHEIGWQCQGCQGIVEAYKTCRLHSTSKILTIVLKRFTDFEKIQTKIDYPIQLDLQSYLYEPDLHHSSVYDLIGVILHHGSVRMGHYTCYCKNSHDGKWYSYDDDIVRGIDSKYIIHQNAYILFYQRKY